MHEGVGTGEFARLVPREPTSDAAKGAIDRDTGEEGGKGEGQTKDAAGGAQRGSSGLRGTRSRRSGGDAGAAQQQQHHHQLLDDLVPVAGRESLPGKGIEFVDGGSSIDADARDRSGGGRKAAGSGRVMSKFERQALEKARMRQRGRMEAGEPQVSKYVSS